MTVGTDGLRDLMGLPPVDGHEALLAALGAPPPRPRRAAASLAGLDADALQAVLTMQAGPVWNGLDALSAERRAAFDAVGPRLRSGQSLSDACADAARRHRFETGVLLDLASQADMSGGMAAWGFARPPDDPVLAALVAGYGKPTIPQAAFGAVAHWIAERGLGAPIPVPDLDVAARHLHGVLQARRPAAPVAATTCAW